MSDDFPRLLDRLLAAGHLSEEQAHDTMGHVLDGRLGPERLAALIVALRAKGPHVDELVGFARAMRDHSHRIDAGTDGPVLDNCGTGGAPRKAFNVSTAAAFALAGAGITVAKHGNRSVTRPSGSADVLEGAGARLDLPPERVEAILQSQGIAFLFAPAFHPAMRHAGPVRQALGIRTVFNLLGPLTNPAGATHQVLGVHDPDLLPIMAAALVRLGCQGGFVLHGHPGYDEATPTGLVQYVRIRDGAAGPVQAVDPKELGIARCRGDDIAPVPREAAPALLQAILTGEAPRPVLDTVALNMAFALVAVEREPDLAAATVTAHDILTSGVGNAKLDAYLAATREPHE
jgi:anthranilate phosphoribosyltransferase